MEYLRLENFRCFEDTGRIYLAPLMLLVGANSSGKSSFLKQFPLIKQSVRQRRNGVFLWNSPSGIDFDNFNNVLRDGQETMVIEYGVENIYLTRQRLVSTKRRGNYIPNVKIVIEMAKANDRFEYLKLLTISFLDQTVEILFGENSIVKQLMINGQKLNSQDELIIGASTNSLLPRLVYIQNEHVDEDVSHICRSLISELKHQESDNGKDLHFRSPIHYISVFSLDKINNRRFTHNWLSKYFKNPDREFGLNELYIWYKLNRILDSLNYYFMDLADNISYVEPIRATAQRYYRIDNIATDEINSDGTNLAMFLYNLSKNELAAFQRWTKKLFKFNVRLRPSEGHVQLLIEVSGTRNIRNMTDMGFGYSQILPILAIIWRALGISELSELKEQESETGTPTRIIVIEQPELHLHPRFISMFAAMLTKIVSDIKKMDKRVSIIIETHSEALIDAVGMQIANTKSFDVKDVKILLFNASEEFGNYREEKKYIQEASFDENGFLKDWPYGFFSN